MPLKLPERFKFTAPVRKVVLLPDTYFFCRTVPVSKDATSAEVAAQIELALEGMAPFPVAQMYHGHFWRPKAKNALVFASYRKRFPTEQVETWAEAEAVLPAFVSMLNAKVADSTTLLLWGERTVTALRWEDSDDCPAAVLSRELPLELKPEERVAVRDLMLRESGASIHVIESEGIPALDPSVPGESYSFKSGSYESVFTREQLDVLDVRDKEELASRRRARTRDVVLWRVLQGCAAALALCLLLEVGLIGGRIWQKNRVATMNAQEPTVSKIMLAENLAKRIEELSTNRKRPFEMITIVSEKLPNTVVFSSATVTGVDTLEFDGQASPSDYDTFRATLNSTPAISKVEYKKYELQNGLTKFRLGVTFKPEAFRAPPQS